MANAISERKSIHKKLIMGLPMARKERAMPNSLPDVQRWNSQLWDSTATPIQRLRDPLQTVQKASCTCGSESSERNVSHHEVIEKERKRGRGKGGKRKRRGDKHLEKVVSDVVWRRLKTLNCVTDPAWSSVRKATTNSRLFEKRQVGSAGVVCENIGEPETSWVKGRMGRRKRKSERVLRSPNGNVCIPMRA
jgi:hypothetical protein